MKQGKQRHPCKSKRQDKMDDNYIRHPKNHQNTYLVESFSLNSKDRTVNRRSQGRGPDPEYGRKAESTVTQLVREITGRKVKTIDLQRINGYFNRYIEVVNMILQRVYENDAFAEGVGKGLVAYRGHGYTFLRHIIPGLAYQKNEEFRGLVFERLHRNALEQAARIIQADYTRRQLVKTAIQILHEHEDFLVRMLKNRRVPAALVRKVRDGTESMKNGSGFHYALSALKQVRRALDVHILETLEKEKGRRGQQRFQIRELMKSLHKDHAHIMKVIRETIREWHETGFPFTIPQMRSYSLDFSASTENSPGQGYWFTVDSEREDEIILHLKMPQGLYGMVCESSLYRGNLSFRFLNWLPRAADDDLARAERAEREGDYHRAEQLRFRAKKFTDFHEQLMNTIRLQHVAYRMTRLKMRKRKSDDERAELDMLIGEYTRLRDSRRSAPPRILLRGRRLVLQIPFLSPSIPEKQYAKYAGVDRGIRYAAVVSVEVERGVYEDLLIDVRELVEKRERLKRAAYDLTSEIRMKKNNWEKKRPSDYTYPAVIWRKERLLASLWWKIRRIDREIARQVASKIVWFCEKHHVKKIFFEDLRSFQPKAGFGEHSWQLSTNLWGMILDTVRYMRAELGHSKYNIWTVNPWGTSQMCHQCGERGLRTETLSSTVEKKGGKFFYCEHCECHFHADVNAARNIIHWSSTVAGRSKT